jgi:phosphatidylglycerophosphate synthase
LNDSEDSYQPTDRRPLASRQTAWANSLAAKLAAAGVTPNGISVFGMICGLLGGLVLSFTPLHSSASHRIHFLMAIAFIQLRLLCNLLDGMVAILQKRASRTGELYNEIPDRISDAATFIGAGYALGGSPVLGFVAACCAIFVAYIRAMGKLATGHQEYCGPMAKPQRMALMTAACIYCAVMPEKFQPMPQGYGVISLALALVILGCAITTYRRLSRIVKMLKEPA